MIASCSSASVDGQSWARSSSTSQLRARFRGVLAEFRSALAETEAMMLVSCVRRALGLILHVKVGDGVGF